MDSKFESIFKARFALFKSEKPDHTGTMELTLQDAMALAEWITSQEGEQNYRGDMVVKIPVKAWNKQTQSGKDWISGLMSVDKQVEGDKSDYPF
jgi:hypothetical protein